MGGIQSDCNTAKLRLLLSHHSDYPYPIEFPMTFTPKISRCPQTKKSAPEGAHETERGSR